MDSIIDDLIKARDETLKNILVVSFDNVRVISRKYREYSEILVSRGYDDTPEKMPICIDLRRKILEKYNNKCAVCGFEFPEILHMHHVIKVSNHGLNTENNIVPLCPNCHTIVHAFRSSKRDSVSKRIEDMYGNTINGRIMNLSFLLKR